MSEKKIPEDKQELQNKIQDIQIIEQSLNNLLYQKQAFQLEFNETENALSEISKTNDDIYKLVSNIMIKADKKNIEEELRKKKDLLSLRLKSIEKQEEGLSKSLEELREDILKNIK